MYLIKNIISNKLIIQKSIFIANIYRVNSIEEANNILNETKKKYYDAKHNCYAYIIGENQETQKCSDDGEPQKTAGQPILEVLKRKKLTNVIAIVTRYFGGILLGTGGLTRAYSKVVSESLENIELYTLETFETIIITTDYQGYNSIVKNISNINILAKYFSDEVVLKIGCKKDKLEITKEKIINLTSGKVQIKNGSSYQIESLL